MLLVLRQDLHIFLCCVIPASIHTHVVLYILRREQTNVLTTNVAIVKSAFLVQCSRAQWSIGGDG